MAVASVRLGTAGAIYVGMKTINNNGGKTMSNDNELKKAVIAGPRLRECPFCGGRVGYITSLYGYRVVCDACDIHGPRGHSAEEAKAKWNKRGWHC